MDVFPPDLELTAEEKTRWSYYDDDDADGPRVGVKLRVLPFVFQSSNNIAGDVNVLAATLTMSDLRSRLIGFTFSGDVEFWQLTATKNDQEYLIGGQGSAAVRVVTLLGNAYAYAATGMVPTTAPAGSATARPNGTPYVFDPSVLLLGSDVVKVIGNVLPVPAPGGTATRYVLNGALWVWGFPGPLLPGEREVAQ